MKPRDVPSLAPEAGAEDLAHKADPYGAGEALARVLHAWALQRDALLSELAVWGTTMTALAGYTAARAVGASPAPVVVPTPEDDRYKDPAWRANPALDALAQAHLGYSRWLESVVLRTPGVPEKTRRTAAFWTRQWLCASAPSNFFWTNPVAQRHALDSQGASLLRGWSQWLDDLAAAELPMTDTSAFVVGRDVAPTPGVVVFRNELIEVIRYTPPRDKLRAVPLVIIPPWINKFYILDLSSKKSMVRFLLGEGFDVFIVSWRNPTAEMAHITLDDYLAQGVQAAIDAARRASGARQVNAVGYCLGGTALAAQMAWLNARHAKDDVPVAAWTLFTTLTDFADPGDIIAFINTQSLATLDARMSAEGGLEGKDMAMAFRLLRPVSLLWNTFVQRYLYGEPLPALDVLFWNADVTRMPRAMHRFYLQQFYQENRLREPGGVTLGGEPIDLGRIVQPLYCVGAQDDHIAPWRSTFRTAALVAGPVRYALSTSGHILGIVNPPVDPPKRAYWAGDASGRDDGAAWLAQQTQQPGSWWQDWADWLHARSGGWKRAARTPKAMTMEAAPGRYVFGK